MDERLQKTLARAGFGSRRACEELIRQGRVRVGGQVAQLGQKADPERDVITVDGNPVRPPRAHTYLAVNKPRGVLSVTADDRGRRTVRDLVPLPGHLFSVGRLDLWSEGLVLLTDDGELANRLAHPRYEHPKEYAVSVQGHPSSETLDHWRQGIVLDERRTAPAKVSVLSRERDSTLLRVVLREGRKRQIRRVAKLLGHPVRRLIRVRIGPVHLGDLPPGRWRRLTAAEVDALRSDLRARRRRPARRKGRR
jgi:pseudouridine synthase